MTTKDHQGMMSRHDMEMSDLLDTMKTATPSVDASLIIVDEKSMIEITGATVMTVGTIIVSDHAILIMNNRLTGIVQCRSQAIGTIVKF